MEWYHILFWSIARKLERKIPGHYRLQIIQTKANKKDQHFAYGIFKCMFEMEKVIRRLKLKCFNNGLGKSVMRL